MSEIQPELQALICIAHLRWKFVFQRPQHLMTRAARQYRTFYIEEPVFYTDSTGTGSIGTDNIGTGSISTENTDRLERFADPSGVVVCTPHILAGLSAQESQARTARLVADLLRQEGLERYALWIYTPMEWPVVSGLSPALTVYDCMDELSGFRHAPPQLREREQQLFARADLVFTGGQRLWEAKRLQHEFAYAFPSSVDVPHFERARAAQDDPADQAGIPFPRLGFYGVLDERFDAALVSGLARRRPEWSVVLLGPVVKVSPDELPQESNVFYLGQKTYEQLPGYLSHWDAALLPFARNAATEFISPTKTPEYLAAGVPVVSTAIHDVVRPYGELDLLRVADDAAGFEAAIDELLAERGSEAEQHRQARADLYLSTLSWDRTWDGMQARMQEALDRMRLTEQDHTARQNHTQGVADD